MPLSKMPKERDNYAELSRVLIRGSKDVAVETSEQVWRGPLNHAKGSNGKFMSSVDLAGIAQQRRRITEQKTGRSEGGVIFCAEGFSCLAFARLPDGSDATGVMGNVICITRGQKPEEARRPFNVAGTWIVAGASREPACAQWPANWSV